MRKLFIWAVSLIGLYLLAGQLIERFGWSGLLVTAFLALCSARFGYGQGRVAEREDQDSDETVELKAVESIYKRNEYLTKQVQLYKDRLEKEKHVVAQMTESIRPDDVIK